MIGISSGNFLTSIVTIPIPFVHPKCVFLLRIQFCVFIYSVNLVTSPMDRLFKTQQKIFHHIPEPFHR